MALLDPQHDAMSLASPCENGLFTGEEVTIKFGSGHLTVLVETDENTDEEDSLSPSLPVVESSLSSRNLLSRSSNGPPEQIDGTDTPAALNTTIESIDEGVDAILIERDESNHSYNDEAHVGHYIQPLVSAPQRRPPVSPASKGKRRFSFRKIQSKMNRLKAVISRGSSGGATGRIGGNANMCDTNGSFDSSNRSGKSGATTPRADQLVQEASIGSTESMQQLNPDRYVETNSMSSYSSITTNLETQLHAIGSIDFDTISKEEYDRLTTLRANNLSSNASNEQFEEYDIVHTSQVIDSQIEVNPQMIQPQPSRAESEQIDPTYTGPYDDNKSLVTYSTGDFDMSKMYSRSWSTIATTTASLEGASLITGAMPTPMRPRYSRKSPCSGSSKQNVECGKIQSKGRTEIKEDGDGVSLDGLSLVNSIVGDDRSYVEDY
jgi:hypothetical protein